VTINCLCNKMNLQLRDRVARQMWQMWSEASRPRLDSHNCPKEFYLMAEVAMKSVYEELDDMILGIIRERLEKLVFETNETN